MVASGPADPRALRYPGQGKPLPDSAARNAADREAVDGFGFSDMMMMEAAGAACSAAIARLKPSGPLRILCGPGNNGGDGWVVARRMLAAGRDVAVLSTGSPRSAHAQSARNAALGLGVREHSIPPAGEQQASESASTHFGGPESAVPVDLFPQGCAVVDALFGPGSPRPLGEHWNLLASHIVDNGIPVLSVDAPSGGTKPLLEAQHTLAIETVARELLIPADRDRCGHLQLVPVGFPGDLSAIRSADRLLDAELLPELLRPLRRGVHKHGRGKVSILAGSAESPGAAVLAALGAEAGPSGLTELLLDAPLVATLAPRIPAVICRAPWPGLPENSDALVLGPGWGRGADREELLGEALTSDCAIVLDADALHLLAARGPDSAARTAELVLTPHPGEAAVLLGARTPKTADVIAEPFAAAARIATSYGAICVLKLGVTVIAHPDGRLAAWDGANPLAASAGSGDVLAGLCGSLLAAGYPAWDAARIAVILHGLAGLDAAATGVFSADSLAPSIARRCGMFIRPRQEYL